MLSSIGHSGAGKSTTLMQILTGTLPAHTGSIRIGERDVSAHDDVGRAHALGIRCAFQELLLFPNLRALENGRVIATDHIALRHCGPEAVLIVTMLDVTRVGAGLRYVVTDPIIIAVLAVAK